MFDVVVGNDGSGIIFESHFEDFEESISTDVEIGDLVELSIEDEYLFAVVTKFTDSGFKGKISKIPSNSEIYDLEIGDKVKFKLKNIHRCIHQE